ncbi:MAG: hypothetical protein ACRC6M_02095 [Microcystaceae cyanobacterium]
MARKIRKFAKKLIFAIAVYPELDCKSEHSAITQARTKYSASSQGPISTPTAIADKT